jgi:hypothetical protein
VAETFERFFRSSEPARDKFLSRLFGLFSEQVVRVWCACPEASYEDLGRPTLCTPGLTRGHTLDFTLRHRNSEATYVSELKCELEYESYRYLRLTRADQIRHHSSEAFLKFLRVAIDPTSLDIRRQGRPERVDGAILIWGAISLEGRQAVIEEFGFADVLSVEMMLADLQIWAPAGWAEFVSRYRRWTNELFDFLEWSERSR